jgi:hypothetical protein
MRTIRATIWATLCMVAMGLPAARAQQQPAPQVPDQSAPPIPAYHSPLAGAADNVDSENPFGEPQKLVPDNRSLAGAQDLSLGAPATSHSYWQPNFTFTSTVDSNGLNATGTTGWTTWSSILGGVDLHRISGNSNLTLSYIGGATISNDGSADNGVVQEFQFGEKLAFRRSTISIFDQMSYLPEAAFGYQTMGGPTLPATGAIQLQPGLTPGQSILTARGQRVSNSLVPEVDVNLTPRSSLTFVGTYSFLHYFDNDLLNYYNAGFQAGYNYQMNRKDTLALTYSFNAYRYSTFHQSINDHVVHVSYGRRVTGKLAFQIAAGPEITSFETPITGITGSAGGTGTGTGSGTTPSGGVTNLYWSLTSSLTYQMRQTGLGLSYTHGVSGGSGVQAGGIADTVTGTVSRQISRTFLGNLSLGYARNEGLTVATPTSTTSSQTFGYWFGNVGFSHQMGRAMNLSLNYLLQYQDSNSAFCVGVSCGSSFVRHQISVTLGWREHPLTF